MHALTLIKMGSPEQARANAEDCRFDYVFTFRFRFKTIAASSVATMKNVRTRYEGDFGTTDEGPRA
jgi:hypothetical protein